MTDSFLALTKIQVYRYLYHNCCPSPVQKRKFKVIQLNREILRTEEKPHIKKSPSLSSGLKRNKINYDSGGWLFFFLNFLLFSGDRGSLSFHFWPPGPWDPCYFHLRESWISPTHPLLSLHLTENKKKCMRGDCSYSINRSAHPTFRLLTDNEWPASSVTE